MKVDNETTESKMLSLFDLDTNVNNNKTQYLEHAKCKKGNPCIYICSSKDCESHAVVCADVNCDCQTGHNEDKLCFIKNFPAIIKMVESKRQSFPDLLKWINNKYDELIDWISKQREEIYLKTKSAGLNEIQMDFLATVYAGKCEELTGKKVHEVVKDLQSGKKKMEQKEALVINRVSEEWKIAVGKIEKEVSALNGLITDACLHDYCVEELNSNIAVTETQKSTVTEMLNGDNRKVLGYELLYRASENNFEASKFWDKCNHKADTVTLIHTEFDKVIGGYTPLTWKKEKNGSSEEDSSLRSFVFSVTEKTKFTLKQANKGNAITHYSYLGPTFGGGHDISVFDNANKISYAAIGNSYENSKVQYKTKEAWQFFQGSTESHDFKIKEWEVWQVIFE